MSLAEIERFAADLQSNEALRADAATALMSATTPTDRVVAFAAAKGYVFTADDVTAYAKARKLTADELSSVVGGSTKYTITIENKSAYKPLDIFQQKPPTIG